MEKLAQKTSPGQVTSPYVVGIGASAGGLEAINVFFENMPHDSGFAFVVVQHLSPDYKSVMDELLSKHTVMPIFNAEDGMMLKPNSIFLLPPKKIMEVSAGKLVVKEKKRNHPNNAIDVFLSSLAKDKKDKAIGIILSGTGSDGSLGIEAIRANGGTVIVQDPLSAEFDGMPNSAIATGYTDLVLSPDVMPEELIEYIKEAPLIRSFNALNQQEEVFVLAILELVNKISGHDFSHYKRATLNRRIAKKMMEKNTRSLKEYYDMLLEDPVEVIKLGQEFLINVTGFFRDEAAFNVLSSQVIPELVKNRDPEKFIKIWVVAASTGEEAYSVAMLIEEYLEQNELNDVTVKIFATDIDQQVLDTGGKGIYPEESIKELSPDRIKRFFIKEGQNYRVIPALRKMVVFARHDITRDPPFSQVDLLCCRNMLIYMDPLLQKNILQKFHFALRDNGFLFLGPSENAGVLKDVLKEVDRKWKIFRVSSKTKTSDYESFLNPPEKIYHVPGLATSKSKNALNHLGEIFKDTLLEEFPYAGIFIDKDFEVKQAIGNFKDYISFPEGHLNFNLLKLTPPDLSIALSTNIRKAIKENNKVVQKNVKVQLGDKVRSISILVKPYLNQKTYLQPFLFVILNDEEIIEKPKVTGKSKKHYTSERVIELENELNDTRANLQAVIEEVETANEELQSSNEEIISANEELQSTNEELQSLNEELHTVNVEHQLKIRELIELNDDLNNYFNNTGIGQILVDKNLVIRKFSPIATRQVNLRGSDIGRSISDISTNLNRIDFTNDIKKVLVSGDPIRKEVSMNNGDMYDMRIAPYVRQNHIVDGVVISFINVTETKKLTSMLEAILNSSTSGILAKKSIRNGKGVIIDFEYLSVNTAAEKMLDLEPGTLIGKRMLGEIPTMDSQFFERYINVVENDIIDQFEYYNKQLNRWYDVICVKMLDGLVTTFNNITEKKRTADLLRKGIEDLKQTTVQLEKSNLDLLQFASVASHDLKEPLRKIQAFGNILNERVRVKLENKEQVYLSKMINAAKRMQGLVDDILTLSKLSNSNLPIEKTDLNRIISSILDDLEITIIEKKAVINVDPLPLISAVPGQMHQLFQNLIVNALKFCQDKTPLISIYQQPITEEMVSELNISTDHHCIVVEDNGIGFEVKYAEKIFGIFQRLNGANFPGTGIGLSICKRIVDNHKGLIYAESKPGLGSRFYVVLP